MAAHILLPERHDCPLCDCVEGDREIVAANEIAVVFADAFPVSQVAHWLVVTRSHIGNMFELSTHELSQYWQLVQEAGRLMIAKFPHTTGVNIGANVGESAGMTVPHIHTHIIARQQGDTSDPRGGVRWVVPEKADYWS